MKYFLPKHHLSNNSEFPNCNHIAIINYNQINRKSKTISRKKSTKNPSNIPSPLNLKTEKLRARRSNKGKILPTEHLARLEDALMRPLERERELEQFVPEIRRNRVRFLADEGSDQILRRVPRPRALPRRRRHRPHQKNPSSFLLSPLTTGIRRSKAMKIYNSSQ